MIQLLTIVAVLATVCLADSWHKRQDAPLCNDNECVRMLQPVFKVMKTPTFTELIGEDGHLNLDCSNSTLSTARTCIATDDLMQCIHFPAGDLTVAWAHFCSHKSDEIDVDIHAWSGIGTCHGDDQWHISTTSPAHSKYENIRSCWDSPLIIPAIRACMEPGTLLLPSCIGRRVSGLRGCNPAAGRLIEDLLNEMNQARSKTV